MADSIQQRVLQAFQQEHRDYLQAIRASLEAWPQLTPEALQEAFRMAHSMKGGARVCDLAAVEKVTHQLEGVFSRLVNGEQPTESLRTQIGALLDAVEDYMVSLAKGGTPEEPVLASPPVQQAQAAPQPSRAPAPPAKPLSPRVQSKARVQLPTARGGGAPLAETVRVSAAHLDRLLQSSGEILSAATLQERLEGELSQWTAQLESLRRRCDEAAAESRAQGGAATQGETLAEEMQRGLGQLTRQVRSLRLAQQKGARTLRLLGEQWQSDVRRARLVPADTVFEGFQKMVRDLARTEGKEVALVATGLETEADRLVLQALKDPIMHALRNALSHGVQTPAERRAAGLPVHGTVFLKVAVTGSQLQVMVEDDGRGLQWEEIRSRAVRQGLVSTVEARHLSEGELGDLLFHQGFTTASEVTSVSGRGVGLAAVRTAVVQLQGSVRLSSRTGGGATLRIAVPLSVATHLLLLVQAGGRTYAVPARSVSKVFRQAVAEIQTVEGQPTILHEGRSLRLAALTQVLEPSGAALTEENGFLRLLLLRENGRELVLGVDRLLREISTIVHPLPFPADRSPFFSGGAVMEGGEVVLVLQATALLEQRGGGALHVQHASPAPTQRRATILVVDDSFTARTLQKTVLETEGYEVRVAVDGVQALGALRGGRFDAVVTDVQMPRMDGFGLLEAIKGDAALGALPVVLVTSLDSEADRARGLSLGADAYIVKQKFDHRELLEVIRQLL